MLTVLPEKKEERKHELIVVVIQRKTTNTTLYVNCISRLIYFTSLPSSKMNIERYQSKGR